jgi:ribosomal protein S18 acetylase RimI-like enzyme
LESFVFPEFRNRGVQKALIDKRLSYLKENGFNKAYVIYEPDNEFSIRALNGKGFIERKRVLLIKILTKYFQKEIK